MIGSKCVRPGDLWTVDGSPPSRCSIHLGRAAQRADLGDAGDDLAVPLHAELEALVGVDRGSD
jgi:hypothetical protein